MTKNTPIPPNNQAGDRFEQLERRSTASSRRNTENRRSLDERRFDNRLATVQQRRTVKVWLRSIIHSRLGVDRRKKEDRRLKRDRRQQLLRSLLTQEEISALLSP
jgi:hypothetical protein